MHFAELRGIDALLAEEVAEARDGVLGVLHKLMPGLVSNVLDTDSMRMKERFQQRKWCSPTLPHGTRLRKQSDAHHPRWRYSPLTLPVRTLSPDSRSEWVGRTFVRTAIDA